VITPDTAIRLLAGHRDALQAFSVRRLWLFGSLARGDAKANDIDLLVEFEHPPSLVVFMQLKQALEHLLQAPVDLVSKRGCSPRFLKAIEGELRDVA